jgi:hypothetical protein
MELSLMISAVDLVVLAAMLVALPSHSSNLKTAC